MMYMNDGIDMETVFGDGSAKQGGILGALMGAGTRLLTGESQARPHLAAIAPSQPHGQPDCLGRARHRAWRT
ncbi:MAG: hypothetical protein ABI051_00735 [Vicinamibacterales bacterium]